MATWPGLPPLCAPITVAATHDATFCRHAVLQAKYLSNDGSMADVLSITDGASSTAITVSRKRVGISSADIDEELMRLSDKSVLKIGSMLSQARPPNNGSLVCFESAELFCSGRRRQVVSLAATIGGGDGNRRHARGRGSPAHAAPRLRPVWQSTAQRTCHLPVSRSALWRMAMSSVFIADGRSCTHAHTYAGPRRTCTSARVVRCERYGRER